MPVAVAVLLLYAPGAQGSAGDFGPGPGSPHPTPFDSVPMSAAVGDFNLDGKDDLATVSSTDSSSPVTILLGDGAGGFTEPATSPLFTGSEASAVAVGDFNRDGRPDLVVTMAGANTVSVYQGDGNGDFDAVSSAETGARPVAVAVGNFDADGKPDVVTADSWSGTATVARGNGSGNLQIPPLHLQVGAEPLSVAVGDFNRDGKQDFATANRGSDNVTIVRGTGAGSFASPNTTVGLAGAMDPRSVAVGDFNHDGRQDLVTANGASGEASILLGNGAGAFTASRVTLPGSPSAVVVGDFNADGREDLAATDAGSGNLSVSFGDGAGNFAAAPTSPEPVGDEPVAVATGDFDRDGKPDLATVDRGSDTDDGTVSILINQTPSYSSVNFDLAPGGPEPLTGGDPWDVVVGDFNRDGKRDLATANWASNNVTVLLGQGTGDFVASSVGVGQAPQSIAVGDFNLDGRQDLVTADYHHTVSILLGDGAGNFTATSLPTGVIGAAVEVADFNRDGKPDLVVADETVRNPSIHIFLGDGAGGFSGFFEKPAPDRPRAIDVGDYNHDGVPDLAVAEEDRDSSNDVEILLGSGSGSFTTADTIAPLSFPRSIAGGDFDRDGDQDLVTANSDSLGFLRGRGDGGFADPASVAPGGQYPSSVAVGDFDDDGKADVAAAMLDSDTVSVLTGNGSGSFTHVAASPEDVGDQPGTVATGDFNGDGRQDLVSANHGSSNVSVLLGSNVSVAVNDTRTIAEDAGAVTVDVRANDTDTDSATEKIASVQAGSSAHGAVAITGGGDNLTYTPDANYCGPASFTYTLSGRRTATVSVTVTCVDDATDAIDDIFPILVEDTPKAIDVRANDIDPDTKDKIASVGNAQQGTVAITNGGDDVTFTPSPNFCGTARFTYTLTSGDTATVLPLVDCVEDAATAVDDAVTVGEDSGTTTIEVRGNDPDPDGEPDFIASVEPGSGPHGDVAMTDNQRDLTYTPDANYCGPASFTYTLTGGDTATVSVTVTCVEDRTDAIDDTASLVEDAPATTINVRTNDTDPDSAREKVASVSTSAATHGTVTVTNGGDDLTFTPSPNHCGPASFVYSLSGGDSATVSIDVACVEDPTVAGDDSFSGNEDLGPWSLLVRQNDVDPDGTPEKIASVSTSSATHGTVTVIDGGSELRYDPDPNYCNNGPPNDAEPDATFSYTLAGGDSSTVTLIVACVPDATTAVDDVLTVAEDAGATTLDVRANDTDPENDKAKIISTGTGPDTHGTVAITNDGNDLTYTPAANYCGPATFTYTLADGDTGGAMVTVTCDDDAPVAVDDRVTVDEGSGPTTIDVLDNDTDVDGGAKQVATVTQPPNGTAAASDGGGGVSYTPATAYCNSQEGGAPDRFTYKLDSGSEATVAVTVRCRPSAPPARPGGPSGSSDPGQPNPGGPGAPTRPAAPRLIASQRRASVVRGRAGIRLSCRGSAGQRCTGTLTLKPASSKNRASAAAAGRARFSIAAGRSQTVRVQPTSALRALLRRRGKAVANLTATMRGDGAAREPLKRRLTITLR